MVHTTIARTLAKRAARRVFREAVARTVTLRDIQNGRRRLEAEVAGQSVGVTLPARADSIGDLPF